MFPPTELLSVCWSGNSKGYEQDELGDFLVSLLGDPLRVANAGKVIGMVRGFQTNMARVHTQCASRWAEDPLMPARDFSVGRQIHRV